MIKDIEKIYWTIGEVAEMLNCTINTIHDWCKYFNIDARRNRRGDRMFSKENVYRLKCVYILIRVEGHTVKGAQQHFDL
jgi:DNA-binding transcriptional MerR regulator